MNALPHELPELFDLVREHLPALLGESIASSRWFADKDRGEASLSVADIGAVPVGDSMLLLCAVEAKFLAGQPSLYFMPLLASPAKLDLDATTFLLPDTDWCLTDAIGGKLSAWLVNIIAANERIATERGSITGTSSVPLRTSQLLEPGLPVQAEQSNSSIIYESMIAKVYRRLSPGVNPDVEIGAFLAANAPEAPVPKQLGSLSYHVDGEDYTLVMLQERIGAPRDGWSLLQDALQRGDPVAGSYGHDLGELTARMHLALAKGTDTQSFSIEQVTQASIDAWCASTQASAETVIDAISTLGDDVNPSAAELSRRLVAGRNYVLASIDGYRQLEGGSLIRVHGDYHLGQVLCDQDGVWWAVDFEGEPRRPIAERVLKTSPLKDVAGMLRSFSYARATALGNGWSTPEQLADWESGARQSFLEAYTRAVRAERPGLLPDSDAELLDALNAWEVDKALYEVQYEIASRPDWLWVPLQSIVERLEPAT